MKQTTVKTIGELTQDEVTEFLKNETVKDDIVEYAFDCEEYHVGEILDYVKDSLKNYSICAFHYNNYIEVDLNKIDSFINGMNNLQKDFELLDILIVRDVLIETELIYNNYISTDMFSDEYNRLENILVENVNELANTLLAEMVRTLEYFSDFETVELESDYIETYLDFHYDTEVAITDKGVTFITY